MKESQQPLPPAALTLDPKYFTTGTLYLAGPYFNPDASVRAARARAYAAATSVLQLMHFSVFSPISQGHATHEFLPEEVSHDHDFWMRQDLPMLKLCDVMVVLLLPNWQKSRGLREEVQVAKDFDKPIRLIPWHTYPGHVREFQSTFNLTNNQALPWPAFRELFRLTRQPLPEIELE